MKNLKQVFATLIVGTLLSANAYATSGVPYLGVKAGKLEVKNQSTDYDPTAYSIYGGYTLGHDLSLEGEYTTSEDFAISDSAKVTAMGAYATIHRHLPTDDRLYGKAKLGLAKVELEGIADVEASGIAGGIAVGMNVSPTIAIEAEYAKLPSEDNNEFSFINLAGHMRF